jgi:hypothetical protein
MVIGQLNLVSKLWMLRDIPQLTPTSYGAWLSIGTNLPCFAYETLQEIINSNINATNCNVTQFIYIWKLFHMFRVVSPPIIMSTHTHTTVSAASGTCLTVTAACRYRGRVGTACSSNSSTIAAGSSNGLTPARFCRYSCVCSWWLVEMPPETCRAVSRCK